MQYNFILPAYTAKKGAPAMSLKSLCKHLNLDELVLDIGIALSIPVVYSVLLPQGPRALAILSPEGVLGVIAFVTFFAALFTARLYARFAAEGMEGGLVKTVVFLAVTGVYLIAIILLAAYNKVPAAWAKREMRMLVVLLPAAFTVSGIMYGLNQDDYEDIRYTLYIPLVMLFVLTPILLLDAFGSGPAPLALGLPGGLVLLFLPPVLLRKPLARWEPATPLVRGSLWAGRMVLLPLVTSLALVLWQELTLLGMVKAAVNNKTVLSDTGALLSCFFGGIIPLRLLAAFTPPVRWTNLVAGAAVMVLYVMAILDLTRALQGG